MGPAGGKRASNPRGCRAVSKSILDNCCRKEKQRPGEDDGHYAGVIDFQRHVLRLASVHFAANYALGVLHGNLAHALRNRDDCSDDDDQEQDQEHKDHRIHLAGSSLR